VRSRKLKGSRNKAQGTRLKTMDKGQRVKGKEKFWYNFCPIQATIIQKINING
jgi:hypothetical protein